MLSYAARRLGESLVVLFVMSFLVYGLIGLMPGDPIDLMISANPNFTAEDAQRLKALYGLDRPLWERYGAWLGAALQGDFGYSRLYQQPVGEILLPRLGWTTLLLGVSLALSLAIAIPLGLAAAARPYSPVDYGINLVCFAGISVPPFWLALILILLLAVPFQGIPAGGMGEPDASLWARLPYLFLPVLTLTLASVGGFTRFMRAAVLEALSQDHIRTARAKGLSRRRILVAHALRNALLPLVTVVALSFGTLFSGALITETMFSWAGMGRTIYEATLGNDYNLALLGLLTATGFTLAGNILADLLYAGLDPRISYRAGGDR
ncbi:MAG: ABC transporter permease [Alphaproteobacteria bacterium]|nr:ABC transporter permease [Alphaproteobacteria bacterium]